MHVGLLPYDSSLSVDLTLMRMCWSKRYSGSEMMGVSFKRQRMVISFRATAIDQPLEMLPRSFTSIWLRNRTFMDPSECSMFSPSRVLTVSIDIQQRNRQFDRFLGSRFQCDPLSHAGRKHTLQATGMVLHKELGLGFCQQCGHAVHDLYPTFRRTVWI